MTFGLQGHHESKNFKKHENKRQYEKKKCPRVNFYNGKKKTGALNIQSSVYICFPLNEEKKNQLQKANDNFSFAGIAGSQFLYRQLFNNGRGDKKGKQSEIRYTQMSSLTTSLS